MRPSSDHIVTGHMYCNKRRLGRSGRSPGIGTRFLSVLILAVLPEMGQTLAERRNIQIRELKDDVKSAKGYFRKRKQLFNVASNNARQNPCMQLYNAVEWLPRTKR